MRIRLSRSATSPARRSAPKVCGPGLTTDISVPATRKAAEGLMTSEHLAAILAERVMRWGIGPDRFTIGGRRWLPRWRFQPARRLDDAFRLLEHAAPQQYTMGAAENGGFWARVSIAGTIGEARESSQARALTLAISRAIGLEV